MPIEHIPMHPRIEGIPVLKDGKQIGMARMDPNGEMIITFKDPISSVLVSMMREGFMTGITFYPNVIVSEPIEIGKQPCYRCKWGICDDPSHVKKRD